MKRLTQMVFGRLGYRIERISSPLPGPHLFLLDYVLYVLNEQRAGHVRFIQIGANDGVQEDPCRAWISAFPWAGILVEPQPALARQLRTLYASYPRIAVEEVLVSASSGEKTLYYLEGGPTWSTGIASVNRAAIVAHRDKIPGFDGLLREVRIEALTFDELITRHALSDIDYLQIDTEGHDFEIIKTIDFDSVRPSVICYEHCNLSHDDQIACRMHLAKHGYQFASWLGDTVACHERLSLVSVDRQSFHNTLR